MSSLHEVFMKRFVVVATTFSPSSVHGALQELLMRRAGQKCYDTKEASRHSPKSCSVVAQMEHRNVSSLHDKILLPKFILTSRSFRDTATITLRGKANVLLLS